MTEASWLLPPVWHRWERWAVSRSGGEDSGTLFSVGSVRRFGAASYEPCGLTVSVGRRSWSVFAVCSRAAYRAGAPWRPESEEFKPLRRSGHRGWWR